MAAFDVATTLDTIQTALKAMSPSRFGERVFIGNPPTGVLPAGFTAVITMDGARVVETTLATTIEVHTARVRIYRAQAEAANEDDGKLRYRIIPEVMDLFKGDFSLGGTIRAIDWGGQYGTTPGVEYEEEVIAEKPYWASHLVVPFIVDTTATLAA